MASCANKSDRKSYMNEIDGFSVLFTFPKPKANRSRKRRQFHGFSLLQGGASLRPIHSYKTACSTSRICSMCFAREENAITRKWQNQKHCPSSRRNMRKHSHLEEWPCCNGATKTDSKNLTGTQAKVQGLQKGAQQLKSRKPLRKTQGQTSFLDRHVRNMENWRGPLNRRIKKYSILQQLNFGDSSQLASWYFHEFFWGFFVGTLRCFHQHLHQHDGTYQSMLSDNDRLARTCALSASCRHWLDRKA